MSRSPLEKAFQAKVVKWLKTLPDVWSVKVSDRAKSGIPDVLLCVRGIFVAMELKRDENSKATPLQLHTLAMIKRAGGYGFVVHPGNWKDMQVFLKNVRGRDDQTDLRTNPRPGIQSDLK